MRWDFFQHTAPSLVSRPSTHVQAFKRSLYLSPQLKDAQVFTAFPTLEAWSNTTKDITRRSGENVQINTPGFLTPRHDEPHPGKLLNMDLLRAADSKSNRSI